MTEIQFLASLVLNESIPVEVRKQFVDRIVELEAQIKTNTVYVPYYNYPTPYIYVTPCQHVWPSNPWASTNTPTCVKCGQRLYTGASGGYTYTYTGGAQGLTGGGGSGSTILDGITGKLSVTGQISGNLGGAGGSN